MKKDGNMSKNTNIRPAVIKVDRHFTKDGRRKEYTSTDKIDILNFESDAISTISVKLGLTLNLGDFESCRADVMVTVPHYEEERNEAFLYALHHAEQKLQLVCGSRESVRILHARAKKALKDE